MPLLRLCVLTLIPGLHGLRRVAVEDPDRPEAQPPDFFACEGEPGEADASNCSHLAEVPSRQMDDLLAVGYRSMRAAAASGGRPLAVHVGADGLANPARWTDMHLYSRVLANAGLPRGLPRLAFVEPVESKSRLFWYHVSQLPVAEGQVSLATAMVDGRCRTETQPLYRVSPQAAEDFDFDRLLPQGWVSTNANHPLKVVRAWADKGYGVCCRTNCTSDCKSNFGRFRHAPNLTDYLEEFAVRCQTLEGVVREAGAGVGDLAMVVVDAEGLDTTILLSLVSREEFRPGFLMWESGPRAEQEQLAHALRQRGYKVGVKTGLQEKRQRNADSTNFVAVLE